MQPAEAHALRAPRAPQTRTATPRRRVLHAFQVRRSQHQRQVETVRSVLQAATPKIPALGAKRAALGHIQRKVLQSAAAVGQAGTTQIPTRPQHVMTVLLGGTTRSHPRRHAVCACRASNWTLQGVPSVSRSMVASRTRATTTGMLERYAKTWRRHSRAMNACATMVGSTQTSRASALRRPWSCAVPLRSLATFHRPTSKLA